MPLEPPGARCPMMNPEETESEVKTSSPLPFLDKQQNTLPHHRDRDRFPTTINCMQEMAMSGIQIGRL